MIQETLKLLDELEEKAATRRGWHKVEAGRSVFLPGASNWQNAVLDAYPSLRSEIERLQGENERLQDYAERLVEARKKDAKGFQYILDLRRSATLYINPNSSKCGNCERGCDPQAKKHEEIVDLGGKHEAGCGVQWLYVSSEYIGEADLEAAKNMRPDLVPYGFWL